MKEGKEKRFVDLDFSRELFRRVVEEAEAGEVATVEGEVVVVDTMEVRAPERVVILDGRGGSYPWSGS